MRAVAEEVRDPPPTGRNFNMALRTQRSRLNLTLGDGRKVCYAFQKTPTGCTNRSCPFGHQCAGCGGPKPYNDCNCTL